MSGSKHNSMIISLMNMISILEDSMDKQVRFLIALALFQKDVNNDSYVLKNNRPFYREDETNNKNSICVPREIDRRRIRSTSRDYYSKDKD